MKDTRHEAFNKRSGNAHSLGKMIQNTKENKEEAEISMEFASPEELENLEEKNARRKTAIARMEAQKREQKAFQARKDFFS